jgi:hypothetical protein
MEGTSPVTGLTGSVAASSRILDAAIPGFADIWPLPDAGWFKEWAPVVLPAGVKEGLLRTVVAGARLRCAVPVPELPLPSHGVLLLTGLAGVGRAAMAGALCCAGGRADHLCPGAVTARGQLVRLGVPVRAELARTGRHCGLPRDGRTFAGRAEGSRLSLRSMSFTPVGISVQNA